MDRLFAVLFASAVVAGGVVVGADSPTAADGAGPTATADEADGAVVTDPADAAAGASTRASIVDVQRDLVNVLEVRSTGSGAYNYSFTVRGFVQKTRISDRVAAEGNDVVERDDGTVTVTGTTGNEQSDAFLFRGRVLSFRKTGGDSGGELSLNGLPVSAADLQNAHVIEVISRDEDEEIGYRFVVDGTVEKTTAEGHSADESDTVTTYPDGTTLVRGSTGDQAGDAYRIEGVVTDFRKTGGDSAYFIRYDGLNFEPEEFGATDDVGDGGTAVTRVASCTTIDAPGTYELVRDVRNADVGTCIRITASDVTFDGDGHRVDGVDTEESVGIDVTAPSRNADVDSVGVRDVRVSDWGTGVSVGDERLNRGATNVTVRRVASTSNDRHGIRLSDAAESAVVDSTARDNGGSGVYLDELGRETVVRDTTASANGAGIVAFEGGTGLTLRDNRVTDNDRHGIDTSNDDRDVEVVANRVANNGGDGLDIDEGTGISIRDNAIRSNGGSGVDFEDVRAIRDVTGNDVRGNGQYGVVLKDATGATVERNTVRNNARNGIALLDHAADNTVRRNTVCENLPPQILVDTARPNTVADNRLTCP